MEQIVIKVEDATAKNWQNVPPKIKSQLEKSFETQIDIISQRVKESNFEDFLKKVREEAANNGLTEEHLQQLLDED